MVKRRLADKWPFLKNYSEDVLDAPVADLELLESFERSVQQARTDGEKLIDLSQGMPDMHGIPEIVRDIPPAPELDSLLSIYPPAFGTDAATRAVAAKIKHDSGISYDPSREILICNGASQGLAHALEAFASPGERIVLFDPCYLFYPWLARTRGLHVRRVPGPSPETGRIDPDRLSHAMRGARIVLVNSPANPDGSMIHPDDLALIARLAEKNGSIILSDEVYSGFCWERDFRSIAACPGARDRTVVVSSVSKSHGLPGLRAGWCAGPDHLIRPMGMLMSIRVPCVNAQAQLALPRLLAAEPAFAAARREAFLKRRAEAIKSCAEARLICRVPPGGAFYLWIDIPAGFKSGYEFASSSLAKARVVMMPGEPFGPAGSRKVRMSWGGSSEAFAEAMQRIAP
ncbi:MAG: putative aminotransferase YugH [Pseudomonadota bacterium]